MSIEKISTAQVGQMMKVAGEALQKVVSERDELKEKVAHYEKKERAERIAAEMEAKGLKNELSFHEKVAHLMERESLDVVEEAVSMQAPQTKTASIHDDEDGISVEGHSETDRAAAAFVASMASLD